MTQGLFDEKFRQEMRQAIQDARENFETMLKNPEEVRAELDRLEVDVDNPEDIQSFRMHLESIGNMIEINAWPLAWDLVRRVDQRIKFMPSELRDRNETFRAFADAIRSVSNGTGTLVIRAKGAGIDLTTLIPPDVLKAYSERSGREDLNEIIIKVAAQPQLSSPVSVTNNPIFEEEIRKEPLKMAVMFTAALLLMNAPKEEYFGNLTY